MDGFFQFIGFALLAAIAALTLRSYNNAMGMAFGLAAGALLLLLLSGKLRQAIDALQGLWAMSEMGGGSLGWILKMLGVSFAAEFAAQACRDAGEEGFALRVELGGKATLLVLSVPLLERVAQAILSLAP